MTEKKYSLRDKFFWICVGFGSVILIYFCKIFFFSTEGEFSDFEKYEIKKDFQIYVPSYLYLRDSVYLKASLQFSDFAQEVFFVVVKENKNDLLKQELKPTLPEYAVYVQSSISRALENTVVDATKKNEIDELPALTIELRGKFADHAVFYIFTVLESNDAFYQIICWTTTAIRQSVKKDIYTATQSFKLL